jgi:hypothetical protein
VSDQAYFFSAALFAAGWLWTRWFGGLFGAVLFLVFVTSCILFILPFMVDDYFPHRVGQVAIDGAIRWLIWSGFVGIFFGLGTLIALSRKLIDWVERGKE